MVAFNARSEVFELLEKDVGSSGPNDLVWRRVGGAVIDQRPPTHVEGRACKSFFGMPGLLSSQKGYETPLLTLAIG